MYFESKITGLNQELSSQLDIYGLIDVNPEMYAMGMGGIARAGFGALVKGTAAKEISGGGLNLFKFGSPQATTASNWKTGDYFLYLQNKGTPKLNWHQNYGALRREMSFEKSIYDSYRLSNGNLIPTGGFLNAERYILQSRGWNYSPLKGAWMPPK